jgi:hypothetical protein
MDIREIAKRPRVSTAMVSRAINRVPRVNPQLAKRVWRSLQLKMRVIAPAGSNYRRRVEQRFGALPCRPDDSRHGIEFMKFGDRVNYKWPLDQMYHALYRENVGVDFIFPESTDLAKYKVIVVPALLRCQRRTPEPAGGKCVRRRESCPHLQERI